MEARNLTAADVMSHEVIAVRPETPLHQAARLMVDKKISGLPVADADGRPIGVLTEGDLLRRVETGTEGRAPGWLSIVFGPGRLAGRYVRTHARRVSEVMTPEPVCVVEKAPLEEVVTLMQSKRVKRVPVVSGNRLVGIVSRADLIRVLADALGAPSASATDDEIRTRFMEEMARQSWTHPRGVTVAVENGTVLLDGCAFGVREYDALRVMAENLSGVRGVENRLVCIEPNTGTLILGPQDETDSDAPTAREETPADDQHP